MGLSPTTFGTLVGIAPGVIRSLESSKRRPRKKTLMALEKHFGKLDLPPEVIAELSPAFKRMTLSELLDTCRELVQAEGIGALS